MQKQFLFLCFILNLSFNAFSQKQVVLPNGWKLSPAGKSLSLGDLPLNIAVSNSKKMLAVTNNGQSKQSLQLIDVATQKVIDKVTIAKSWLGLKFSADEKYLYAAGGNDNCIWKYAIINNKLNIFWLFAIRFHLRYYAIKLLSIGFFKHTTSVFVFCAHVLCFWSSNRSASGCRF